MKPLSLRVPKIFKEIKQETPAGRVRSTDRGNLQETVRFRAATASIYAVGVLIGTPFQI